MSSSNILSIVPQDLGPELQHTPKNAGVLRALDHSEARERSAEPGDAFQRLRHQLSLLNLLLDQLPDPVFIYDAQGRQLYINAAGEKILGLSRADWMEKSWEEIGLPPGVAATLHSWSQPIFSTQSSLMMEQALPTVDGIRTFECLMNPIQGFGSKQLAVACLRDITDRKRMEQEAKSTLLRESQARRQAERACRRSNKLLLVTAALSEALSASEVVEVILGQAITALDAHGGVIAMIDESGSFLELVGSIGAASPVTPPRHHLAIDAPFPLSQCMRTREPVWIESEFALFTEFPDFAPLIEQTNFRALAAIPLVVEGNAIGAMSLRFKENREFAQEERNFILTLAGQCAQALERARCYEKEKCRRSEAHT